MSATLCDDVRGDEAAGTTERPTFADEAPAFGGNQKGTNDTPTEVVEVQAGRRVGESKAGKIEGLGPLPGIAAHIRDNESFLMRTWILPATSVLVTYLLG